MSKLASSQLIFFNIFRSSVWGGLYRNKMLSKKIRKNLINHKYAAKILYEMSKAVGPNKLTEDFLANPPKPIKPIHILEYIEEITNRPWPEVEAKLAQDGGVAINYALYILKDRFLEGEPAIFNTETYQNLYFPYSFDYDTLISYYETYVDRKPYTSNPLISYVDMEGVIKKLERGIYGSCDFCEGPLPKSEKDIYHSMGGDGQYCSEGCAENSQEGPEEDE